MSQREGSIQGRGRPGSDVTDSKPQPSTRTSPKTRFPERGPCSARSRAPCFSGHFPDAPGHWSIYSSKYSLSTLSLFPRVSCSPINALPPKHIFPTSYFLIITTIPSYLIKLVFLAQIIFDSPRTSQKLSYYFHYDKFFISPTFKFFSRLNST